MTARAECNICGEIIEATLDSSTERFEKVRGLGVNLDTLCKLEVLRLGSMGIAHLILAHPGVAKFDRLTRNLFRNRQVEVSTARGYLTVTTAGLARFSDINWKGLE